MMTVCTKFTVWFGLANIPPNIEKTTFAIKHSTLTKKTFKMCAIHVCINFGMINKLVLVDRKTKLMLNIIKNLPLLTFHRIS